MQERIPQGETVEIDGKTYFIIGGTRIEVCEHFPESGKTLSALLEDLIRYDAEQIQK